MWEIAEGEEHAAHPHTTVAWDAPQPGVTSDLVGASLSDGARHVLAGDTDAEGGAIAEPGR